MGLRKSYRELRFPSGSPESLIGLSMSFKCGLSLLSRALWSCWNLKFPVSCSHVPIANASGVAGLWTARMTSKCEGKKDDLAIQPYKSGFSLTSGMFMGNGSIDSIDTDFSLANPLNLTFSRSSGREGSLGLIGLHNLGNTCFMNSALQCLVHTSKLFDYFLGDYSNEINQHNPLGMDGDLALAFGQLVRKLWAPGRTPVAPQEFQELLAFLLDGLHEDLNRVKSKPYIEAKNADGQPDEEVSDEYWHNHLACNDSIIVDACRVSPVSVI
ncbi:hypothetical protein AMTR_s00014p00257640 [Amborella trichopoda]|uniref:ubiquitinyl hydrolase 1 n=1 Tax=Amborella trichopoda TaxID=13333 RepID=W1PN69_AMBTC|nr:hypothetical protein AMTR_s00014p00257640 [Amborella trichopoda]